MAEAEAQAWWVDVEHLRERIERRREAQQGTLQSYRSASGRAPVDASASWRADGVGRRREHVAPAPDAAGTHGFIPRRTVRIRGQAIPTVPAPRLRPVESPTPTSSASSSRPDRPGERPPAGQRSALRRPPRRVADRVGDHPDRLALWAVLLGVLLALVAVGSAHGAVLQTPARVAAIVRPVAWPPSAGHPKTGVGHAVRPAGHVAPAPAVASRHPQPH